MSDLRRVAFLVLAAIACAIGTARGATGGHASRDARVHLTARDEWWSLHGELRDREGRRFAFHTTFFRYGLGRGIALHAAVVTILDERSGRTAAVSRVARAREADSRARGIRVDDWSLRDAGSVDLAIGDRSTRLALAAYPIVAPVPSPAANGYAIVRMRAHGSLTLDGRRVAVRGDAWLDHEYEVVGAPPRRVGRDRFELMFDDGRAIELVAPRLADGRYGPFRGPNGERERESQATAYGPTVPARGFVVERDGRFRQLGPADVTIIVQGNTRWRSPHDDATYPALWAVAVAGFPSLALEPLGRDQEFVPHGGGVPAWIGAIDLSSNVSGERLGAGSVELTGYASATR